MQLTSTNRPFGLTIKFTRCRYSCQYPVATTRPKLDRYRNVVVDRQKLGEFETTLTTVRRRFSASKTKKKAKPKYDVAEIGNKST